MILEQKSSAPTIAVFCWTTSSTCYQKSGPRRLFHFSAGLCAKPQCPMNHRNATKRHSRLHCCTLWPPETPDLNPAHKVRSVMQEQTDHIPIHDVNYLKRRLMDVWEE